MKEKRAYTGIEPVTSRTLSENHTTRPAGRYFDLTSTAHEMQTALLLSKRCCYERTIFSIFSSTAGSTPILRCFCEIVL